VFYVFYLSVIRPVLEYCSVVWHHSLSKTQCETPEAIQRRAIRIIYPVTVGMPYIFALSYAQIPSLHSRCEDANKRFFRSISHPSSCILSLLPPQRDSTITSRLRSAAIYPRPATNKTFYIFGSVFSVKLSIDWINKFFYFFLCI